MASSGEGIEVAALRKRIEYGLTMLGKEVNASTRERMKNAIQADRDRLKRLETDQVLRKPQRIVPVRLESKVWEVIEEASRSHYQDDEQQGDDSAANDSNSFPFHPPQPRRRERYASRPSTPETPWIPHKEDDETRRAQIIAEHQRRREVLLAQLSPEPASSKQPTAEERRRAEDAERRKREQARLDLKTAIPRERSAGGGVTYAWVSPTVGSFGADVHERMQRPFTSASAGDGNTERATSTIDKATATKVMKEPQRIATSTYRVFSATAAAPAPTSERRRRRSSSRRPKESKDNSSSESREARTSHHRPHHHDPRSPRNEASYPPRSRADRTPISATSDTEQWQQQQRQSRLRRRDSERSNSTATTTSSTATSNKHDFHDRTDRAPPSPRPLTSTSRHRRERDRGEGQRYDNNNNNITTSYGARGPTITTPRHRSPSREGRRRSRQHGKVSLAPPPAAPTPPVPGSLLEELLKRGPWRAS